MGLSSSTGWLLSGTADFSSPAAGSFCWSGDHRLAPQAPSADRRRDNHLSRHPCQQQRVEDGGLVLDRDYFLAGPRERGDPAIPIATGAFLKVVGRCRSELEARHGPQQLRRGHGRARTLGRSGGSGKAEREAPPIAPSQRTEGLRRRGVEL